MQNYWPETFHEEFGRLFRFNELNQLEKFLLFKTNSPRLISGAANLGKETAFKTIYIMDSIKPIKPGEERQFGPV